MSVSDHKPHNIPTSDQLIAYLISHAEKTGRPEILRRDIAKAFHIKGETARRLLKQLLSDMVKEGALLKRGKTYWLPAVRKKDDKPKQKIKHPTGDSKAAKVPKFSDNETAPKNDILGVLQKDGRRVLLAPLDRKDRALYVVSDRSIRETGAQMGDYVRAGLATNNSRDGIVKIQEILTSREGLVRQLSTLAIKRYDIPDGFPDSVIEESEKAQLPKTVGKRQDIRDLPLVTIDDSDARDHDDAVYSEPDTDENNAGGWRLLVAIADVSHFVKPLSKLDIEAFERGNSTYFPDRVVPMLPARLSNDLCSLVPDKDRPCLAVWMQISKTGKLISQKFFRGMMRSHAKLTYQGVQNYKNKTGDSGFPKGFDAKHIDHLYQVFDVLNMAREKRGTLEIDMPEQRIFLNQEGQIEKIEPRPRLDAHQLIEEFMVLANVAAAKFITHHKLPCLFRVHDTPAEERIEELGTYLKTQNLPASLPKGNIVKPRSFTQVLRNISDHPLYTVINQMVLRSQSRAEYQPDNVGHFGLNLTHYAHFTSPIRRYADLLVHRTIGAIIDKKPGDYPYTFEHLNDIGQQISECERRSTKAERETIDRYVALHLEDRSGEDFKAVISGMTEFAIFLTLSETKSDGILPLRNLGGDYFTYDAKIQSFYGRRTRTRLNLGDELDVSLEFANPISGSVVFSAHIGKPSGRGKPEGRKFRKPLKKSGAKSKGKFQKENKSSNRAERQFDRRQGQFKKK